MNRSRANEIRRNVERAAALQDDETALESVWMYPTYADLVAEQKTVDYHFRFRYENELWRTEQPSHTFNGQYAPGQAGTESLYSRVPVPGQGDTPTNPIPYNRNMELIQDKYYSEADVIYVCIRSTGVPVYNPLADLVGIYVEAVSN